MGRLLHLEYTFNMQKKRFKLLDHPDILLISCLVFSTKLLYPFDDVPRPPLTYRDPSSLQMNWEKWREIMRDTGSEGLERHDIIKLQSEDAWTMSDRKIDDYLDWFEETHITAGRETQELRELFPLGQRRPQESRKGLTEEEIDERLTTAQSHLRSVAPRRGDWLLRLGENHAVYRSVEDLPDTAKTFYGKAAELSGLSTGKLVKAVYTLERYISRWSLQEIKTAREAGGDDILSQLEVEKDVEQVPSSD